MPGECAECNGPAEIEDREWAPVELCVPCALELRGRPTQADLAGTEQAAAAARDAQWLGALTLSVDGVWTPLGEALTENCGHVDHLAGNPSRWPLGCCVGCAAKALRALLETKP